MDKRVDVHTLVPPPPPPKLNPIPQKQFMYSRYVCTSCVTQLKPQNFFRFLNC